MEYEIPDNPEIDYDEQGEVIENHPALRNQSSVNADEYPEQERKAASLVKPNRKR